MSTNKLGLLSIILLGVNAIIGTGIFLLPGKAAALVGVNSLWVIVFDALLVMSIALCFAKWAVCSIRTAVHMSMQRKHLVTS